MRRLIAFLSTASLIFGVTAVQAQSVPFDTSGGGVPPQNYIPPTSGGTPPANIPNMPGNFGQPGPGGQQFGPSPEQQQQMEQQGKEAETRGQEMEARGKEQAKKGLEQMKRGMKSFGSQLEKMKKRVAKLQAAGITPPGELSTAMAKAGELIQKVQSAEAIEDVQDLMDDFQGVVETITEQMPEMERLAQFPKVLKKAKLEVAKLDKLVAKAQAAQKRAKIDMSSILETFSQKVAAEKQLVADAEALAKDKQSEDAFAKLEDFFNGLQDTYEENGKVQAVTNFSLYAQTVLKGIKAAKTQIKALARRKIDVTELNNIITESEQKYAELKTLLAAKPIDPDAVLEALNGLEDLRTNFTDKYEELSGQQSELPGVNMNLAPKMNLNYGTVEKSFGAIKDFMSPQAGQSGGLGQVGEFGANPAGAAGPAQ
ncbi:MAG: hypothetical protein HY974_02025 [Candidatus Kerfeldbacteria bacterium]|nr:hypothetical protein [Candidatus Kerfeldbacteria bacterium]